MNKDIKDKFLGITKGEIFFISSDSYSGICDCNKCKHMLVKEWEQTRNKEPHICTKLDERVKHSGMHPRLPSICNGKYFEKDTLESLGYSFEVGF